MWNYLIDISSRVKGLNLFLDELFQFQGGGGIFIEFWEGNVGKFVNRDIVQEKNVTFRMKEMIEIFDQGNDKKEKGVGFKEEKLGSENISRIWVLGEG